MTVAIAPEAKERRVSLAALASFHDRQKEATEIALAHQFTLYGGSRGPGKSYWLRWFLLDQLRRFAKDGLLNVVVGLFCEDYPTLTDRQVGSITTEFPRWLGEVAQRQTHGFGFYLKPEYGGGVIALRNLDDPSRYQSAEFAAIGVDELARLPQQTFDLLRGSLRWPGVPKPRFVATANPGGIGHAWVKRYWLTGELPAELEPLRDEFAFVRALPTDNPHLAPSYWEMLETLPPDLARAWRYGDWDVFAGQYFGELRKELHGYTGETPPGWSFRCMDYGEASPSAVYWVRVDHDGNLWVYRELYGAGMIYSDLAKRILALTPHGEEVRYTVAPHDVFAVMRGGGVSGAEIMGEAGLTLVSPTKSGGGVMGRVEGWRHLREWLASGKFKVHLENCPNFWRTVPTLIHDENHPEDLDSGGDDHCADGIRYGITTRPRPEAQVEVKPVPATPDEWLQHQELALARAVKADVASYAEPKGDTGW